MHRSGAYAVSDLPPDRLGWVACARSGRAGAAIFLISILSFAALSACKQADPNFNPYKGWSFDGGK
jgi:hypothetical protein